MYCLNDLLVILMLPAINDYFLKSKWLHDGMKLSTPMKIWNYTQLWVLKYSFYCSTQTNIGTISYKRKPRFNFFGEAGTISFRTFNKLPLWTESSHTVILLNTSLSSNIRESRNEICFQRKKERYGFSQAISLWFCETMARNNIMKY